MLAKGRRLVRGCQCGADGEGARRWLLEGSREAKGVPGRYRRDGLQLHDGASVLDGHLPVKEKAANGDE